jgi:hypothetical protein
MPYRRSAPILRLTVCALLTGLGACEDDSDLSMASNNQRMTAECAADAGPPLSLTGRTIYLWPPNHKLHAIDVADCAALAPTCDPDVEAEIVWASSDEPVDDRGDGHHGPDILVSDCHQVQVRAERQGPKDGRVYKLGVRAVDRAGNVAESVCTIVVDHDKSGRVAADSGEAYRIILDGAGGRPYCDGTPPALPDAGRTVPPDGGMTSDAGTPDVVDPSAPSYGDDPSDVI